MKILDINKKEDIECKKMKDFIFDEFVNKLNNNNDIDNILNFIDCLEEKFQNEKKNQKKRMMMKLKKKKNE